MQKFDLFDGHADTLFRCWGVGNEFYNGGSLRENCGHLDLLRTRTHLENYCQFFAIFGMRSSENGAGYHQIYEEQLKIFQNEIKRNSDLIVHCRNAEEAALANGSQKAAAFLAVEGAELLNCGLKELDDAYKSGVRAINLTWNHANELSGSCRQEPERGLSEQGRAFVCRMQEVGMIVDVSHLSDPGFWDVAELAQRSGKPFMAGHSNSRAVCPHVRNLTDEQFLAIIKCRGVAGLNMCDDFIGERPTIDKLVGHVEHWMSLGGKDSIAIGGDWDGCDLFPGMEDITGLEQFYERLLRLNYSEAMVRAIFFDNMMRVVREVCTT